jgi:hypothetical protein
MVVPFSRCDSCACLCDAFMWKVTPSVNVAFRKKIVIRFIQHVICEFTIAYPCFLFHAKFGICKHTDFFFFLTRLGYHCRYIQLQTLKSSRLLWATTWQGHAFVIILWCLQSCRWFLHFNTSTFCILVKPTLNHFANRSISTIQMVKIVLHC